MDARSGSWIEPVRSTFGSEVAKEPTGSRSAEDEDDGDEKRTTRRRDDETMHETETGIPVDETMHEK